MSGKCDSWEKAPLIRFLWQSHALEYLDPASLDWDLLIRQARYANLLSRVAVLCDREAVSPPCAHHRQHLSNALKVATASSRANLWEINSLYAILARSGIDFCLLKGSAYSWLGNSASLGRLFGDIDILVRSAELSRAESLLVHSGWVHTKLDSYDQQYYRRWMHELPPLHHTERHSDLDVHHSIIPPISRSTFNIDLFWGNAIEQEDFPGLYVLHPDDRILHSACHLFHEGEFEQGLRDIVDLDAMLREQMVTISDWGRLIERANHLDLSRFVYYALALCAEILQTPIPVSILNESRLNSGLSIGREAIMKSVFNTALLPDHPSLGLSYSGAARLLLFARSHWIRMPLPVLVKHMLTKGVLNPLEDRLKKQRSSHSTTKKV